MSTAGSHVLALVDQASRLLAEANSVAEIKSFHDKVAGVQFYIREARLGLALLNQAAEAKLRAERKAGLMLRSMKLRGGDRKSKGQAVPSKLENLGVSRQESKRWQRVAAFPEREFCEYFRKANELGVEATSAGLQRVAAPARICRDNGFKSPRCQNNDAALCDGVARPEAERAVILGELVNHFGLLSNVLRPLCDHQELQFERWERQVVGQFLDEMRDLFHQLHGA
jgi:hypothetical protein